MNSMSFAKERERRANAGSRMRALLDQEIEMEDLFEIDENEEDEEFPVEEVEEEEDKVDSDFDLDSSEGEQEQIDEGKALDKEIEKEERKTRKNVTMKTAIPVPKRSKSTNEAPRKRRNVGQTAMTDEERQTRYSSRKNTVLSRILLEGQLKEQQKRKKQQPKKERPIVNKLTQEELLAEAAITEEKNKSSLLEWQRKEAERKENAKVKEKKDISVPYVRYYSFIDSHPDFSKVKRDAINKDQQKTDESSKGTEGNDGAEVIASPTLSTSETHEDVSTLETVEPPLEYTARNLITFVESEHQNGPMSDTTLAQDEDCVQDQVKSRSSHGKDKDLESVDLVDELKEWLIRAPRPNKPILCPITGKIAKYRDPKTNIPYANIQAYNIIKECLQQKMNWSSVSGLFLGNIPSAKGVPDRWTQ
ncbi:YL1 nuclear protein-domain-containing protein [Mycotypha africana]|uniref:YL1 nuclear protein-domain-containing protein n=1 Tax=Mycotypha africana TaxID=64632 RepID=UPI002300CBC5|nr:YL1 nuclear protein-domain-containing protein [Mycotypha africana]KAI8968195.1 YL1 nuclear protein-domain-containing protein [Mycotypha africana]